MNSSNGQMKSTLGYWAPSQAETDLGTPAATNNTLANQLVTAVLILDQNLTICYVNPAAEALLIKSLNNTF